MKLVLGDACLPFSYFAHDALINRLSLVFKLTLSTNTIWLSLLAFWAWKRDVLYLRIGNFASDNSLPKKLQRKSVLRCVVVHYHLSLSCLVNERTGPTPKTQNCALLFSKDSCKRSSGGNLIPIKQSLSKLPWTFTNWLVCQVEHAKNFTCFKLAIKFTSRRFFSVCPSNYSLLKYNEQNHILNSSYYYPSSSYFAKNTSFLSMYSCKKQ